jgi:hypothetical protein
MFLIEDNIRFIHSENDSNRKESERLNSQPQKQNTDLNIVKRKKYVITFELYYNRETENQRKTQFV